MLQSRALPVSIATRLSKIVASYIQAPDDKKKQQTYNNLLAIIASMVSVTSASLLFYNHRTKYSTVLAEYDSQRSGILERRLDVDASYDEHEYKILFKWIEANSDVPLMLHMDGLPHASAERRKFQSYAIYTALYLPIFGAGNTFQGYIELWESRYKRIYNETEINHLMQATTYITTIISA